jgi:hypothetical protein
MIRFSVIPICALLCACSNAFTGVGIPSTTQISDYYDETNNINAGPAIQGRGKAITAGEYLIASVAYTNQKCEEFFIELEQVRQGSEITDKIITLAVAAGSPLMAQASSAHAVSGFSSLLASANGVNKAFSEIYLLSAYTGDLKRLVTKKMTVFLDDRKINDTMMILTGERPPSISGERWRVIRGVLLDNSRDTTPLRADELQILMKVRFFQSPKPVDLMLARNLASGYAAICSLQSLRAIVGEALKAGKVLSAAGAEKGDMKPAAGLAAPAAETKSLLSNEHPVVQ